MTEFKPGDRVKHAKWGFCTLLENDEGWWKVRFSDRSVYVVRPSELTPADPGPDEATLKVRELCAAEAMSVGAVSVAGAHTSGHYDEWTCNRAFAKYLRANPPLTVERLTSVLEGLGYDNTAAKLATALHAALTEKKS